ncbi:MAG TPA: hypothetical protein VK738_19955 [Terriglobales bacterium]|jgi:hypothetical protein|nr:hypothetical protein [Terriglobales bacterium]
MKPRILSYRVSATHETITALGSINDPVSISDFDAFVIDPDGFYTDIPQALPFFRRQSELSDLLHKKGGVVVCILQPNNVVPISGMGNAPKYGFLNRAANPILSFLDGMTRAGAGSTIRLMPSGRGATSAYLQILKENLRFTAFLETTESEIARHSGTIFAVNSVGHPIALEFPIEEGLLSLIPPAHNVPEDRVGAAIARLVYRHFNDQQKEVESPLWTSEILVPGSNVYDDRIAELKKQHGGIGLEISSLEAKRDELRNRVRLLFGYGKVVLEGEVRAALRLLGFHVKEPEEYTGEWDVDLHEPQSGKTAIGEVEGSEGVIDVDKYRQLLDYIEAESLEGREHKGILIGNGFRLQPLDAPEREQQFSPHALRGAMRNQFCLLPTTELFKAVCAVLETQTDEALKATIRNSILSSVGIWTFAR